MSDAMREVRYLVVGAGMSGLAFADWVKSDDVLVLEAEDEVGGYCRTIVQDGFVWDYSGHFFHFRHPEIERYLVDRREGQKVLVVEKDRVHFYVQANVNGIAGKDPHLWPRHLARHTIRKAELKAVTHAARNYLDAHTRTSSSSSLST